MDTETVISSAEYQRQAEQTRLNLQLLQNIPTFGFSNLLADWIFLRYLQYFGDDEARAATGYALTIDYFRPIIGNDPRFRDAYLFLATGGSLYAAQPQAADELMAWGLQFMQPQQPPYSYWVWENRGVNQLLFLDEAKAAQSSFEQAAAWAATYQEADTQVAAANLRQTAEFLERDPENTLVRLAAWFGVLRNAPDETTQERVIREIEALGGRVERSPDGGFQLVLPDSE
ncbi:MAG: hypothetical protein HC838_01045 [Spirulinaceae cyanobacterium RM2_2_10]|nr:hypothetical protein [Spirulinaceae cyanobacterium RM2_2_10]